MAEATLDDLVRTTEELNTTLRDDPENYRLVKRNLAQLEATAAAVRALVEQGKIQNVELEKITEYQEALQNARAAVNPRAELEKARAWNETTYAFGEARDRARLEGKSGMQAIGAGVKGAATAMAGGRSMKTTLAQQSAVGALHMMGFMLKSPIFNIAASKLGAKLKQRAEVDIKLRGSDEEFFEKIARNTSGGTGAASEPKAKGPQAPNQSGITENEREAMQEADERQQRKFDSTQHKELITKLDEIVEAVHGVGKPGGPRVQSMTATQQQVHSGVRRSPTAAPVAPRGPVMPPVGTSGAEAAVGGGGGLLSNIAGDLIGSYLGAGRAGALLARGKGLLKGGVGALTKGGLGFKGAGQLLKYGWQGGRAGMTGGKALLGGAKGVAGAASMGVGKGLLSKIPLIGGLISGGMETFDSLKGGESKGTAIGKGLLTGGGAVAGTALGGLVGGPVGAMIGAYLGDKAGSWMGKTLLGDKKAGKEGVVSKVGSFLAPREAAAADIPNDAVAKANIDAAKSVTAAMPVIAVGSQRVGEKAKTEQVKAKQSELKGEDKKRTFVDRMANPLEGDDLLSKAGNALWKLTPMGMFGTAASVGQKVGSFIGKGGIGEVAFDAKEWLGKKLGSVSSMFEGGGGKGAYGTVSSGAGDAGGKSYGKYQYASANGSLAEFLRASGNAWQFQGLQPGSKEFDAKWKELSQTKEFQDAQDAYATKKYYGGQVARTKKAGIDLSGRGKAVQEALMSTGVQYGGGTDTVVNALRGMDTSKMTDAQIIDAIQSYKAANVSKNFRSSSPQVQAGVAKRIERERQVLQKLAAAEQGAPNAAAIKDKSKVAYDMAPTTEMSREAARKAKSEKEKPVVVAGGSPPPAVTSPPKKGTHIAVTSGDSDTFVGRLYKAFALS